MIVGTQAAPTFPFSVNKETAKMETLSPLSFLPREIEWIIHHFYFSAARDHRGSAPLPHWPVHFRPHQQLDLASTDVYFNFIIKEGC